MIKNTLTFYCQGPPSASAPAKKNDIRIQHKPFSPLSYGIRPSKEAPPAPLPAPPPLTSAPPRLVASVQASAQGRVQYHDLANNNNNNAVLGVERQDSFTNTQTQHQVNIS